MRVFLKSQFILLVETVRKASDDQAQDLAAAISFWAFFSIFPLMIGILALTGYFLQSAELKVRVFEVLTDLLPGSAPLVRNNLETVMLHRGTMGWISIGGLLWTAGKGFGVIIRAVNQTLAAKRTGTWLLSSVRSFAMSVAVSVLMIISVSMTIAVEIVLKPKLLARMGIGAVEISHLTGRGLSLALVFLIFVVIYRLAPYVKVQWRQVLPGAFLATVLFELGKSAFVFYLDRWAHFEAIYGPLTSTIVLLLWLYASALILILGAEYNVVYWKSRAAASATLQR